VQKKKPAEVRHPVLRRSPPSYTEAGMFCEANCITITDGDRTALYIPLRIVANEELAAERADAGS
jgi:hypothetical protein